MKTGSVSMSQEKRSNDITRIVLGIGFTVAIAVTGIQAAKLPFLSRLGSMVLSILIAIVYRQVAGYPEYLKSGIQFSAKKLLRLAIVLFGFRLNLVTVLSEGLGLLVRDLGTVAGAILLTLLLAKWLKADPKLSLLVGVGTGVCGAAAIAAVSPIIDAKEDDTAVSVGMIALTGTVFAVAYSLLRGILPLSDVQYGTWVGVSLHEIAHVAAAASPAGSDALAVALLAKLGRVLLLIPLCFILVYFTRRASAGKGPVKVEFPWFLAGFIACSVIESYAGVSSSLLSALTNLGTYMLTSAMVGLGLNVSLEALGGGRLLRPFAAMLVTSVALSVITYFTIAG
ncbi:MAG: YeiH family protein [Bacillota bacterium]